ncbi:MAG: hypothetical protein IKG98_05980 [Ruminococcus sp.]|nr:hypothetical protein [Ruminococcus sp.]
MKKYAVYKSDTGQYCYRYADSLALVEGTGFEGLIREEQLPVVFDNGGGYFKFDPNDSHFVEVIESDKAYPLPLDRMFKHNDPTFKLGWISPDGDTYSCGYTSHNKCAEAIARTLYRTEKYPELTLHNKGWLEVIDSWDGKERTHEQYVHSERGSITRKQADRLFDLGLYEKPEVQALISSSESKW